MKTLLNYFKIFILFFIPKRIRNKPITKKKFSEYGSQPFIVTVNNTSDEIKKNFEIFGSCEYIDNSGFDSDGNLILMHDVVISSGIANISYKDILWSLMNKPILVGITYIQSVNSYQIKENILLIKKEITGNSSGKFFAPFIDPYQMQNNILAIKNLYEIDGFTKLIIDNIAPKTSVTFHFYSFIEHEKPNLFEKFINWLQKR